MSHSEMISGLTNDQLISGIREIAPTYIGSDEETKMVWGWLWKELETRITENEIDTLLDELEPIMWANH